MTDMFNSFVKCEVFAYSPLLSILSYICSCDQPLMWITPYRWLFVKPELSRTDICFKLQVLYLQKMAFYHKFCCISTLALSLLTLLPCLCSPMVKQPLGRHVQ